MKFITTNDISTNIYLRNILILMLVSFELFVLTYVYFQVHSIGLYPSDISNSILGNEDLFIDPKSFIMILEELHVSIFIYIMVTTISMIVFTQIKKFENWVLKISLFVMLMILIDSISLPLLLVWDIFAYIKTISFILLNVSITYIIILNILFLLGYFKIEK